MTSPRARADVPAPLPALIHHPRHLTGDPIQRPPPRLLVPLCGVLLISQPPSFMGPSPVPGRAVVPPRLSRQLQVTRQRCADGARQEGAGA